MLNLRELQTFVAVANEGSFGGAARVLFYSQPTVSAHIAHLEREFGGRLFERSRTCVELTALGREILPRAQTALDSIERVQPQPGG
jgi:DNA-binding transcriptional LysR family regulator